MTEDIINLLFNSGKVKDSEEWDAIYQDDLPIAVAASTAELEEALNIAKDSDYGLGGGVFTKDLNKAAWTASKLQSGQVYVNKWFTGSHATPFGGYKHSGIGREAGAIGIEEFLEVKSVGGWNN